MTSKLERFARASSNADRPRFYLQIIPSGGMDAVHSTDPKSAKEVDTGIDAPHAPNSIVHAGNLRLSPTFKTLERWSSRLTIVNGFRQNSANHQSGLQHVTRFKSRTATAMPTLFDIVGARRSEEAVGAVTIGHDFSSIASPNYLGEPGRGLFGRMPAFFEHLDRADPDDLREAARTLRAQADKTGRRASNAERVTAENVRATAMLFERVAASPRFAPAEWTHPSEATFAGGSNFQRALWLFENRLARCVTICVGRLMFDTHTTNDGQIGLTSYLAFILDKLFKELDARKLDGKSLSAQTAVVIGSEIGRFPRINAARGKDHLPQAPYMFFGAGFKSGELFGGSDRQMIALPVSLTSGRPETAGHPLWIDDLGTTLLAIDGANPEPLGYSGSRLRFLEA